MDQAIGVFVFVGIVGGVGAMVTVAIAETRGLIRGNLRSAGWFFFGLLVPVVAPIVALLLPRRPHRDGAEAAETDVPTGEVPRRLTPAEREVLLALLRHEDFPGHDALLAQVDRAWVEGACTCGCASVHLSVRGGAAAVCPSPLPTEADVLDEEGDRIGGIIVFVHDGYLSYLEVYASVAAEIDAFPPVDRVRFQARTSPRQEVLVGS